MAVIDYLGLVAVQQVNNFQAHNELLALLWAMSIFQHRRRYVTDALVNLSLAKRPVFMLQVKVCYVPF